MIEKLIVRRELRKVRDEVDAQQLETELLMAIGSTQEDIEDARLVLQKLKRKRECLKVVLEETV